MVRMRTWDEARYVAKDKEQWRKLYVPPETQRVKTEVLTERFSKRDQYEISSHLPVVTCVSCTQVLKHLFTIHSLVLQVSQTQQCHQVRCI